MLPVADIDGDDVPDISMMPHGPLGSFNFTFNVQPAPLPSAVILLGSDLLGFVGIIMR
jgi:hypothetical protein